MRFCWEHPALSQVYCWFSQSAASPPWQISSQTPSSCSTRTVSAITIWVIPAVTSWALFYVETACLRSAGNWAESVSLYNGQQSNFRSWSVTAQRQTEVVAPILQVGENRAGFVSHPFGRSWLQVVVLVLHLSQRHRHKGALRLWLYWKDYCHGTWYLGLQRLGSVTYKALLHPPLSLTETEWNHISMDTSD